MIRFLRRLTIGSLLVLLGLSLGSGGVIAALLLKPWRYGSSTFRYQTLRDIKVPGEEILVQTEDGLALTGWWALHPDARGRTVVLCHALGEDKRQVLPILRFLFRAGYNVLAFDWRNHGQSEGRWTTYGGGEKLDLDAVLEYLQRRPDLSHPRIALLGLSMGASVALLEAADSEVPQALILDSPYADLYQVLRERAVGRWRLPEFPLVPLGMFISEVVGGYHHADVRPQRWVDRVTVPTLYIRGALDQYTPRSHVMALFRNTQGPKELWVVPKAGHATAFLQRPELYEQTVLRFLGNNLR